MVNRETLKVWVIEALENLNGSGRLIDVVKQVWKLHRSEIEKSGDIFYTWQYDIRWAGMSLRKQGFLTSCTQENRGVWALTDKKR